MFLPTRTRSKVNKWVNECLTFGQRTKGLFLMVEMWPCLFFPPFGLFPISICISQSVVLKKASTKMQAPYKRPPIHFIPFSKGVVVCGWRRTTSSYWISISVMNRFFTTFNVTPDCNIGINTWQANEFVGVFSPLIIFSHANISLDGRSLQRRTILCSNEATAIW